jgi:cytochrome c oxidase subunit 2
MFRKLKKALLLNRKSRKLFKKGKRNFKTSYKRYEEWLLKRQSLMEIGRQYVDIKSYIKTKNINHNTMLEIIWTIVPIIILIIIAIPSLNLLYFIENPSGFNFNSIACSIMIIGHQWYWSYEFIRAIKDDTSSIDQILVESKQFDSYLLNIDDIISNRGIRLLDVDLPLLIPSNSTIYFNITSSDVLHSWAIPSLGIKVDAVPGRLSLSINTIRSSGIFYGQCSEICGIGHGFMPIKLIAI